MQMSTAPSKATLLPLADNLPAIVPSYMAEQRRWAPWRAQWSAGRGKWDKIPVRADQPEIGLSSASPERWTTLEAALAACRKHPDITAGIGFCLTGLRGVVAIDLDGCSDLDGNPAPWAAEILSGARQHGGYCERSPSGTGFRIFMQGVTEDWTNHTQGIEVYAGNAARFVTVTGHELGGGLI